MVEAGAEAAAAALQEARASCVGAWMRDVLLDQCGVMHILA